MNQNVEEYEEKLKKLRQELKDCVDAWNRERYEANENVKQKNEIPEFSVEIDTRSQKLINENEKFELDKLSER